MTINFPNSPTDGDRYDGFIYTSATDTWDIIAIDSITDAGDVSIPSTPANNASFGFDHDSQQWEAMAPAVSVGQVFAYSGTTAPEGYLICNGQEVSQTTYSDLFSVCSTSYNTGEESSGNFRVPDLKTRIPVQVDASDSSFNLLGKTGGSKNVTLDTTQIPSHTHTQLPHNHIQNAHNHTQASHSHTLGVPFYPSGWEAGGYGTGYYGSFRNRVIISGGGTGIGSDGRAPAIQNQTATNQNTTAVNQNTGGGQAHNNLQSYVVVQYIIKT